jgi:methylphosphonate synthase
MMAKNGTPATQGQNGYLKRLGARILNEANDLKRTPAALAKDLEMDIGIVNSVLAGEADETVARDLLFRMADRYPVSLADIWVDQDDTDGGVRIMRVADSEESSRVFERPDAAGKPLPYYEYRDTAMSRTAPFRPEWIRELRVAEDSDPANPDVVFNKGHLAHQQTFFIGPVNFYWEIEGERFCAEMETGDSNYIMPFVPHSFASRNEDEMALIIAVTYSEIEQKSLADFSTIGVEAADAAAGDLGSGNGFARRLERQRAAESLSLKQLAEKMVDAGLKAERASEITEQGMAPNADEIDLVAGLLNVRPEDLMVSGLKPSERVVVSRGNETQVTQVPDGNEPRYRLRPLARSRHQPYLKGFELTVLSSAPAETDGTFNHGLHEYIYNYGNQPVRLNWGQDGRVETLEPGDSAYIRPFVAHGFNVPEGDANLVMIRIPGNFTDPLFDEYASFPPSGRSRVAGESEVWF